MNKIKSNSAGQPINMGVDIHKTSLTTKHCERERYLLNIAHQLPFWQYLLGAGVFVCGFIFNSIFIYLAQKFH